jgi:hypothetical protein
LLVELLANFYRCIQLYCWAVTFYDTADWIIVANREKFATVRERLLRLERLLRWTPSVEQESG